VFTLATTATDQLLLSKREWLHLSMKLTTIHVYILPGVVNSSSAIIRESHFATEEQWAGKAGALPYFAVCQAINVNSTFSHIYPYKCQRLYPPPLHNVI